MKLKLFQELKDEAYSHIEQSSIEGLKDANKIYDIDPMINNSLLSNLLEKGKIEDFIDYYFSLIQTLTFNQKIKINSKKKNLGLIQTIN